MGQSFEFGGEVELFPQEDGWYYVRVPQEVSEELDHLADRGLIAVDARLGSTKWETSLLPMGDGTHFVALNAKVRKEAKVDLGDEVHLAVSPKTRQPRKK